jgi:hypothetical protein
LIEALVESYSFLPQWHLAGLAWIERQDGIANEGTICDELGRAGAPEEGQSAAAYPARLLANDLVGFAADRDIHCGQPSVHRRAKLNFPASRSHGLRLKIKQDHPGDGACIGRS